MDRRDFDGMDKAELLIAIEKAVPGLSFPETASREDLVQYLEGTLPADLDEDTDDRLGVGVRNRGPRTPTGTLYAAAEPEREVVAGDSETGSGRTRTTWGPPEDIDSVA